MKKASKNPAIKEVYYVRKLGLSLFQLRKLSVEGQTVLEDVVVAEDIPPIILRKWQIALYHAKLDPAK